MQNASEGMVLVTVGVIMPMIALSEVGRDKVAARRTCLNAGRQKVNRPNVAPMGVTSPPIYWWVVDINVYLFRNPHKFVIHLS